MHFEWQIVKENKLPDDNLLVIALLDLSEGCSEIFIGYRADGIWYNEKNNKPTDKEFPVACWSLWPEPPKGTLERDSYLLDFL